MRYNNTQTYFELAPRLFKIIIIIKSNTHLELIYSYPKLIFLGASMNLKNLSHYNLCLYNKFVTFICKT